MKNCFRLSHAVLLAGILGAAPSEPVELSLTLGTGMVIDSPDVITRISASAPEIADAVPASRREVLINAKALGKATLVVWCKSGERTAYNVTVGPDLEPLRKLLRETFPEEDIGLLATREALALVGHVSSQAVADRALALVTAAAKGAVSNLQIAPAPQENQVLLRVRFVELNRTALSEFGVNLLSTGALNTPARVTTGQFPTGSLSGVTGALPGTLGGATTSFAFSDLLNIFAFRPDLNLAALIRDLESRNLLQILAEPNLVATSGKEASFLAGGEFPVPVVQGGAAVGAVTIQFREFGIRLSFTPLVTPQHTIRLHVRPEVSSLDAANGVTISGFRVPALTTRRVETDIELAERQSFVIGGLIDDRMVENLAQVPGLAHIPLLGALFKSRSESRSKTELIVIVTPETA
ncbi:MAG TPA: pilus assembly protein N-terminal domain-containing protein, partial [Bryobacteraceae bacterium]|nr:pilus assembly protein N-terminal domain-containing protein [Bryobacteraceae bacterium]